MEIKTFKALMKKLDLELTLTEENLIEKSKKLPMLYNEYLDIFSKELRSLKKLSADKHKKFGELYKHFKYFDNHNWETKGEIETQILAHDEYYALVVEFNEQETMVKQLEMALENIKRTSFQIKNIIEYKKFVEVGF